MISFNEQEVIKALKILKNNNELFEIRVIANKNWKASGYFTNVNIAIQELKKLHLRENSNIYFTLNKIDEACYSRKQKDKFVEQPSVTTSDSDITVYQWLMIDVDPTRPSDTSSSDEQLKLVKEKTKRIYKFMQQQDWHEPVIASSGNGCHLLYRISLKNTRENVDMIKKCLKSLAIIFDDENSKVDCSTFNPSRICKLYGTYARKGSNTIERPHRLSKIEYVPNQLKRTDIQVILKLANTFDFKDEVVNPRYLNNKFNLEDFIKKHNISVKKVEPINDGKKYLLEECFFDSNHKCPDSAIFELSNGVIGYKCFHNSCNGKTWHDVRMMFEPEAYNRTFEKEIVKPNYKQQDYKIQKLEEGKPVFKTASMIRQEKVPEAEYIKTGIINLDRKIRGLKKGFVTVLSGLRACGKSSLISQIVVEAVNQGYKVAMFSGELTNVNALDWLELQAAGRDNVYETQYRGFYKVENKVQQKIDNWLDNKVYIYNNEYGNNFKFILEQLKKVVEEKKVDLVILDNLMALNISTLDQTKFMQQSLFVEELENFAKMSNIHILFVAHPRKSNAFLRLEDVSGSNDIINRVDNALILHRVNTDFKRLSKEMFGNDIPQNILDADNVIEICKDRETGIQDEFIPLSFEYSCKRLCNYKDENKHYKWEISSSQELK